jgi:hypothetical protein
VGMPQENEIGKLWRAGDGLQTRAHDATLCWQHAKRDTGKVKGGWHVDTAGEKTD